MPTAIASLPLLSCCVLTVSGLGCVLQAGCRPLAGGWSRGYCTFLWLHCCSHYKNMLKKINTTCLFELLSALNSRCLPVASRYVNFIWFYSPYLRFYWSFNSVYLKWGYRAMIESSWLRGFMWSWKMISPAPLLMGLELRNYIIMKRMTIWFLETLGAPSCVYWKRAGNSGHAVIKTWAGVRKEIK